MKLFRFARSTRSGPSALGKSRSVQVGNDRLLFFFVLLLLSLAIAPIPVLGFAQRQMEQVTVVGPRGRQAIPISELAGVAMVP